MVFLERGSQAKIASEALAPCGNMPINIFKLEAKLRRGKSLASSLGMYESDANAQRTPMASLKGS
jgi:hypothetical protein